MVSQIHSILFEKDKYSKRKAIEWVRKHGFIVNFPGKKGPHETTKHWRFRQLEPNINKRYRTKKITDGIKFVFSF
jgi:hypothetical protein